MKEEGLQARFDRHERNHRALLAGLAPLGLQPAVSAGERLWMLNSVRVPDGLDDRQLRSGLLERHGIEIGAGLGPLVGKIVRIGLMGESSTETNVRRLLAALASELKRMKVSVDVNCALDECDRVYSA